MSLIDRSIKNKGKRSNLKWISIKSTKPISAINLTVSMPGTKVFTVAISAKIHMFTNTTNRSSNSRRKDSESSKDYR